jgi:hypothetical protein
MPGKSAGYEVILPAQKPAERTVIVGRLAARPDRGFCLQAMHVASKIEFALPFGCALDDIRWPVPGS